MLTPLLSPRNGTPEIASDEAAFEKIMINFHQVKAQLQLMLSEHPATDIASGHI